MDSPGTLNPELLVQNTRRLLSRIASPSLFVALDRPVSPRKKSDTGHQIKAATPIIIDLTGISDDGDDIPAPARPPSVPRRLLQDQFSQDFAPSKLHRTTHSLVEDKTRGPPKLERLFPPVLTPEIPLIPDSTEPTISPREISTIPCHSTKLQPLNQEWIQHFRQRRRDKYRSPTRHTARRRLPVAKIQRAKRPLMKPKISTQRGRKKPVLHVRDVYEDFEASQRCNDERGSWSSTSQGRAEEENKLIYLPRIESYKEVAMEDVKEFEKKESEFKDAFSQTIDHVLGKAEDDALAISFTSTSSQTERPTFLKPLSGFVRISLGPHTFDVYRDFLQYRCPILLRFCMQATSTPECLANVDPEVFGLFVQWLYTQSLLNKYGQPAYQHRLIGLWVLARRLCMEQLQNDAINMLDERRILENCIQVKSLRFVFENTENGDALRKYLVDACLPRMQTFSLEIRRDFFPNEFEKEVTDAELVRLERDVGEDHGQGTGEDKRDMRKYHVC